MMPDAADAKTVRRWPDSLRILAWVALCVALAAFSLVAIVNSYAVILAKVVSDELEQRTVAWEKSGFSRPVLRGVARPGNAAVAHFEAVAKIGPTYSDQIGWTKEDCDAIRVGAPPPILLALARAKAEGLSELRAATQNKEAWKPWDVRPGVDVDAPTPYPKSWRALLLLLSLASEEPGDECLRIAVDGLRTMWDIAPSGGKIGQAFGSNAAKMVLPFATTCLQRARPADIALAAAEFRGILRHAPTLGEAIYADHLSLAWLVNTRGERAAASVPPTFAERLMAHKRRVVVGMQRIQLDGADLFRGITPDRYPWVWQDVTKQVAGLPAGFKKDQLGMLLKELERWVNKDREAQALMRAMVLGLGLLSGAPEALAGDSLLRDPFSGGPLVWRRATATAPAVVYSVGPDGKDDGFAAASDDVGLTFPAVGQDLEP
jgi:hypothetical protein